MIVNIDVMCEPGVPSTRLAPEVTLPARPAPRPASAWTLAVVCAGNVLTALDLTIVNVALPHLGADLGAGLAGLQWVVNAYTLAFASVILVAGAASDRLGDRPVFTAGVATFTAASVGCAAASSPGMLVAFRVAQGLGAAMVLASSMPLIARSFTGSARAGAIAAWVTVGTAAGTLGPLVGGLLVDSLGWRGIFLVNLPVGLLLLVAATHLPGSAAAGQPGHRRQLDLAGAATAAVGLFALNYAVLTGPAQGWQRLDVLAAGALAVLALLTFVLVQRHRGPRAMFDLRLFGVPTFSAAIVLSLLTRVSSFGVLPFLVVWFEGVLGLSGTATGLCLLALSAPILAVSSVSAPIQRRLSPRALLAIGNVVAAAGALLLLQITPDSTWTAAVPGLVLLGAGVGLAFPPLMGLAVGVVAPAQAGVAAGMANTFFPLGTAVGVAVFGAISTAAVGAAGFSGPARDAVVAGRRGEVAPPALESARAALVDGLHLIVGTTGVLCLLAAVVALVLVRDRDRVTSGGAAR